MTSEAAGIDLRERPWWQQKRTWATVFGLAGIACSMVPAAQVAAAPLLAVAGVLGWTGVQGAQNRQENVLKAIARNQ